MPGKVFRELVNARYPLELCDREKKESEISLSKQFAFAIPELPWTTTGSPCFGPSLAIVPTNVRRCPARAGL